MNEQEYILFLQQTLEKEKEKDRKKNSSPLNEAEEFKFYSKQYRGLGTKQSLKDDIIYEAQSMDIVPGFPVNKRMKYNRAKMIEAIQNGMIIQIVYRGDKDDYRGGRPRVIYPMVLGVNKNTGNELVRGWHLEGYSVSVGKETERVWRLFKTVNILWMEFTGNFFRLPPKGYKMQDRVMTERTLQRADFNVIRRNQDRLVQAGKIEVEGKDKIKQGEPGKPSRIKVKNTNETINLKNIFDCPLIKKNQLKNLKISFLKKSIGDEYLAVLGAIGTEGGTVQVYDGAKLLGTYRTVKAVLGEELKKMNTVQFTDSGRKLEQDEFPIYKFERKL